MQKGTKKIWKKGGSLGNTSSRTGTGQTERHRVHEVILHIIISTRQAGYHQLDAELLDAAMSVGELDEGLAGGRLRLPDADDREHVPERCQTVVMPLHQPVCNKTNNNKAPVTPRHVTLTDRLRGVWVPTASLCLPLQRIARLRPRASAVPELMFSTSRTLRLAELGPVIGCRLRTCTAWIILATSTLVFPFTAFPFTPVISSPAASVPSRAAVQLGPVIGYRLRTCTAGACDWLPAAYLYGLDHLGHLHLGLPLHRFPVHPGDLIARCQCSFQGRRRHIRDSCSIFFLLCYWEELELKNVCLSAGDHLTVKGVILHHGKQIDLGTSANDLALHFNPRFHDNHDSAVLVCNSKSHGCWGHERREGHKPSEARRGGQASSVYTLISSSSRSLVRLLENEAAGLRRRGGDEAASGGVAGRIRRRRSLGIAATAAAHHWCCRSAHPIRRPGTPPGGGGGGGACGTLQRHLQYRGGMLVFLILLINSFLLLLIAPPLSLDAATQQATAAVNQTQDLAHEGGAEVKCEVSEKASLVLAEVGNNSALCRQPLLWPVQNIQLGQRDGVL
ncbi:hypothetical protein CRUP_037283 [Coryphaenoides rupestris]|nr:hypothetical protein CRUP_037283 [Coryphaenoides rupestris]